MLRIENVMCIAVIIFCLLAFIGEIPWLISEFKKLRHETDADSKLNYRVYAYSKGSYHSKPPVYKADCEHKAMSVAKEYVGLNYKVTVCSYIGERFFRIVYIG